MIIDTLDHANLYTSLHPRFVQAFEFLKDPATASLPDGRYELDGDALYASIQEYHTRESSDCCLEAHRRYIDIQYLYSGNEEIGYAPLSNMLEVTNAYDAEKDILFFKGIGTPIAFHPNAFFILYPQDAHAPGIKTTTNTVKKIVIKIAL